MSMGDEAEADRRRAALGPYRLDDALLRRRVGARDRAALPARASRARRSPRRSLYGERSAVWDQAENRLHAQKALLELLLGADGVARRSSGVLDLASRGPVV